MENSGHPHKQAVAAALHNAKDGDIMSQTSETKLAGSMTASEVNAKNKEFWAPSWGESTGESGNQRVAPAAPTEYRGMDAYDAAADKNPQRPNSSQERVYAKEGDAWHGPLTEASQARQNAETAHQNKMASEPLTLSSPMGSGRGNGPVLPPKKKTGDQPSSPTGVGSPSTHEGMAQGPRNTGPVGDESDAASQNLGHREKSTRQAAARFLKQHSAGARKEVRKGLGYLPGSKRNPSSDELPETAGGVERAVPVEQPPKSGYGAGAKDAPRIGPKTEKATKRATAKANSANQQAAWNREQERVRIKHGMGRNEQGGLR